VLEKISIVDTPGVLSGEKQRIGRSYDFPQVVEWFAQRADRILLLFDAHKLDISDEFKAAIEALRGHDEKIRVVLNKADMVGPQQLMRIYGALMWSLGKVIKTPEVMRVYIGSFWDRPLREEANRKLFQAEQSDLLADLRSLPRNSALRKVNEFVKRARLAKVHAYIIAHLKEEMPVLWGKSKKQERLIDGLPDEFRKIHRKHLLPPGDFPNVKRFQTRLRDYDLSDMYKLKPKMLEKLERVLSHDIPELMKLLPGNVVPKGAEGWEKGASGATDNPFDGPAGAIASSWTITRAEKEAYDAQFYSLGPSVHGRLSGEKARPHMVKSNLSMPELKKVWTLADVDKDGMLDSEEFAVAMYLIERRLEGDTMPEALAPALVPPSKRTATVMGV
jgi:hypothetical protein